MRMIIGRSLTPLNVKSSRTLHVRRTSDQTVYRHDDNSRRTVQNVPADSSDDCVWTKLDTLSRDAAGIEKRPHVERTNSFGDRHSSDPERA
jgi:hypothetical protein